MHRFRAAALPLGAAATGLGLAAAFVSRERFKQQIDALETQLAAGQISAAPRTDLPPEVTALATRLGANPAQPARFVDITQSGAMWSKPGGSPNRFTASQRIGTSRSGFVWRASIGPFGAISVVDSFVEGHGMLEARLMGTVRVARIDGTPAIDQGEALRYLAELPLNPDGILFDDALAWSVEGPRTIRVSTGLGASHAEITFELDDAGLIATASAASRAFGEGDKRYPWRGRFWDIQDMSGRRIPMQAEVAWIIDGTPFTYWRGKLESWRAA